MIYIIGFFYTLAVIQGIAIFMWLAGWWAYKTDAFYRVKFGRPKFWFWNQLADELDHERRWLR